MVDFSPLNGHAARRRLLILVSSKKSELDFDSCVGTLCADFWPFRDGFDDKF